MKNYSSENHIGNLVGIIFSYSLNAAVIGILFKGSIYLLPFLIGLMTLFIMLLVRFWGVPTHSRFAQIRPLVGSGAVFLSIISGLALHAPRDYILQTGTMLYWLAHAALIVIYYYILYCAMCFLKKKNILK